MSELATLPKESAKAAAAFADYVNLGPGRSLRKLVEYYNRPSTYLRQLAVWSTEYHWQERLAEMSLSRAEEANEYRADTWVAIAGEYHRRVVDDPAMRKTMKLESLNSIWDRVKPEQPTASGNSGPTVIVQFAFIETNRGE